VVETSTTGTPPKLASGAIELVRGDVTCSTASQPASNQSASANGSPQKSPRAHPRFECRVEVVSFTARRALGAQPAPPYSEGHDLVNKQGTKIRTHSSESKGHHPKRFFPSTIHMEKRRGE
jgi:hypothetical protein